jgi:hypothetical protein
MNSIAENRNTRAWDNSRLPVTQLRVYRNGKINLNMSIHQITIQVSYIVYQSKLRQQALYST